ncbi:MAG: hypothetical protein K940chlam7_01742 [Chlamydiae bacterium]|nr:hypothetical protein [Chlamydiota bacterium]
MRIQPRPHQEYPWYVRLLLKLQRRKYGKELDSSKIWARSPKVFLGLSFFYGALDRKSSPLDPKLSALIKVRVSQINHCEFCIDINTAALLSLGGHQNKIHELQKFQESPLFSEKEKTALTYAEAITFTDRDVTDVLFSQLKEYFSDDEIVELTGLIAFQNCSSKFNNALNIPSQSFCVVPSLSDLAEEHEKKD